MSELNILYGCDDNYAPYTGISMTSLFENNRHIEHLTVYFAGDQISPENKEKFDRLAYQYDRTLVWLDTKRAMERTREYHCKGWNGSLATWLRFFVLEQIPETVKTLLWLDSDTLVVGRLDEIADLDFAGNAVAAVGDASSVFGAARVGLSENETYFNAGVIAFCLDAWRSHGLLNAMMQHLQINVDRYTANDQDLLNDYFRSKIKKLDLRYNCQGILYGYDAAVYVKSWRWKDGAFYSPVQIQQAKDDPAIIHFLRYLGDYPWTRGDNLHPMRGAYEKWRDQSPWHDCDGAPARREKIFRTEKLLYRSLPRALFLRLLILAKRRA